LIFRQGDVSDVVYMIESGAVDIFGERADRSEEPVSAGGLGEFFGEPGPLLNLPRSASARAREDITLTSYSVAEFRRRFR
jgi:putative ABC transport system ATP-binding protein